MEEEKVSQEILDRNRTANEIIELMQKEVDEYDGPIVNDKIRMYKKWNLIMYKNVQR